MILQFVSRDKGKIVMQPSAVSGAKDTFGTPLPWVLVVAAAGAISCLSWYQLVRLYRSPNSGKFK